MNAGSRHFALLPEKESEGRPMEGIIGMGYGDLTNPWDILKAGWKNLTGSSRKANLAYPEPSAETGTAANPYADAYTRNRVIPDAIESGRRQSARQPAPYAASPTPSITENRPPVFRTELMNTIHDAALKNLPLIASNPYRDIPFYKNNAVVDAWYRKINTNPRHQGQASTGVNTGRYRSPLEGTIAGEPYATQGIRRTRTQTGSRPRLSGRNRNRRTGLYTRHRQTASICCHQKPYRPRTTETNRTSHWPFFE